MGYSLGFSFAHLLWRLMYSFYQYISQQDIPWHTLVLLTKMDHIEKLDYQQVMRLPASGNRWWTSWTIVLEEKLHSLITLQIILDNSTKDKSRVKLSRSLSRKSVISISFILHVVGSITEAPTFIHKLGLIEFEIGNPHLDPKSYSISLTYNYYSNLK